MSKLQGWITVIAATVATFAFGTFAYLSVSLNNEVQELEALNDSMRSHLIEKDARIEYLEGYITTLEGE